MKQTSETVFMNGTDSNDIMLFGDIVYMNCVEGGGGGGQSIPNWQLGDRLDGKATFVGYFDSVNPDDQSTQRYAYFALDGNYRTGNIIFADSSTVVENAGLPIHDYSMDEIASHLAEITESATYTMNKIKAVGISNFPAFESANGASVSFNGQTYNGIIPNLIELKAIYDNSAAIDAVDVSGVNPLSAWSKFNGTRKDFVWSATISNINDAFGVRGSGAFYTSATSGANNSFSMLPIIEIPVPAGHGA